MREATVTCSDDQLPDPRDFEVKRLREENRDFQQFCFKPRQISLGDWG